MNASTLISWFDALMRGFCTLFAVSFGILTLLVCVDIVTRRAGIASIPDGVYRFKDYFDNPEIDEPLEKAVVDKRAAVQRAVDKVHALEILFKVDLAGALGVTITFTSGDGD